MRRQFFSLPEHAFDPTVWPEGGAIEGALTCRTRKRHSGRSSSTPDSDAYWRSATEGREMSVPNLEACRA